MPDDLPTYMYILWPVKRWVNERELILWASDDVLNGEHSGPIPTNAIDAVAILQETGSVTFGVCP